MTLVSTPYESPVGRLTLIGGTAGLRAICWPNRDLRHVGLAGAVIEQGMDTVLRDTVRQLDEYFAGARTAFELPLELEGTPFQLAAWRALGEIPYGETRSYAQQAARIGRPNAVRAVGTANGRNPVSIVLPCHRVVGSDGRLHGFGGGLEAKAALLQLEQNVAATRHGMT